MAFNLHGESLEGASQPGASPLPVSQGLYQRKGQEAGVDAVTGREIQRLAERKEAAVAEENYDEAKALKAGIERLRLVGARILELEIRSGFTDFGSLIRQSNPSRDGGGELRCRSGWTNAGCFDEVERLPSDGVAHWCGWEEKACLHSGIHLEHPAAAEHACALRH